MSVPDALHSTTEAVSAVCLCPRLVGFDAEEVAVVKRMKGSSPI